MGSWQQGELQGAAMDGAAAAATGSGGGHRRMDSRIEEHGKYLSESSCCPQCGHKTDRKLVYHSQARLATTLLGFDVD